MTNAMLVIVVYIKNNLIKSIVYAHQYGGQSREKKSCNDKLCNNGYGSKKSRE